MNEEKVIMIGESKISGRDFALLMEKFSHCQIIPFNDIENINETIKLNHSYEGTFELSKENFERLKAFGGIAKEDSDAAEALKELFKTHNNFSVPLENEPSKYFSKPKNNFKRR